MTRHLGASSSTVFFLQIVRGLLLKSTSITPPVEAGCQTYESSLVATFRNRLNKAPLESSQTSYNDGLRPGTRI
jgi:hypothetical protein